MAGVDIQGHIAPEYINVATRNQVLLERLKSGEAAKFGPFLERMELQVRMQLVAAGVDAKDAARLGRLLGSIEQDLRAVLGEYRTALTNDLIDIAIQQAEFEAKALDRVSKRLPFEAVIPTAEQIRSAVLTAPLSVVGYNQGALLEPWIEKWSEGQIEQVTGVIRQGYYQGQSTDQIVQALRGTARARYKDGTMDQIQRSDRTVVRTAVQHMSTVARNETYARNSDIIVGVMWVATLDSRTTIQCSSLDGKRFPLESGPRPPIHPNCRSTTVPVLDDAFDVLDRDATRSSKGAGGGEQVTAGQTYYQWLKTQPAAFQDAAIGPDRGKLLRNGGLSAERFAELQLGQNFQPLTLEDMRRLEPLAFDRAGI